MLNVYIGRKKETNSSSSTQSNESSLGMESRKTQDANQIKPNESQSQSCPGWASHNMGIIIYSESSTGPHVQKRFWSPKASSTRVTLGQNFFSSSQGWG